MRKTILLMLALVVIFPLAVAGGVCGAEGPIKTTSKSPIHITSDRLDAYDDKGIVLFTGNVVATQDNTVINSDELYLYYDKKKGAGDSLAGITTGMRKIERIELKGNVTIKKETKIVTGDRAVFYDAEQRIIMTGNAVMRDGDNVIKGNRITVFLDENRGVVDGSGGERVTAIIYPDNTE
ncbi:MAG: lipopolysaccharide transport periplasmic protein LptA [Deltaproteobacteria bacterium]|nr:lipopolysaccharide transport periplasmic protein LptA [Deltaproteobacteria bacterium]